ncbi:MAG: pectin acetylesterase-family hydrolase, partial [Pseudomonadota bacterium]
SGCGTTGDPTTGESAAAESTAATPPAKPASPALSREFKRLGRGWQRIEPAGDTACSDGSPFAFFVRRGEPEKLLFYLQGGGACWNNATCDPLLQPTYSQRAPETFPENYDGIFNYRRSDNPFADHTVVFVPYCSADVHIGDATVRYERSAGALDKIREKTGSDDPIETSYAIEHRGFANVGAALDWTFANVTAPRSILVTGSSAGSIPSPYYALRIARHYDNARIVQLGDAAGGYRRSEQTGNPNTVWNTVPRLQQDPAYTALTDDNFTYEQLYIMAAAAAPNVAFAAYDAAEDDVQKRFLALSGVEMPSLKGAIDANQNDIRAAVDEFVSYIAGGDSHTILARPEFYTFTVGDYPVRKWVDDLAQGKTIPSVSCSNCAQAEILGGGD